MRAELVEVLFLEETSALIRVPGHAPVWVETSFLEPAEPPLERERGDKIAKDLLLLKRREGLSYGAVRKPVCHGDIVFFRADHANAEPMRLLCQVAMTTTSITAMLIDASLPPHLALDLDWSSVQLVETSSLNKTFRPAFPLPDGTPSPGWSST